MKMFVLRALVGVGLAWGGAVRAQPPAAPPAAVGACPPAAYLTFESGRLAAVDWVEPRPGAVHTLAIVTQSRIVDATIELRPDQTAARSSVSLSIAGEPPASPNARDLGAGAIYWSDFVTSSLAQAIARARLLDEPVAHIPAASLFSSVRGDAVVERLDATDWKVTYHNKRYLALTDRAGCLVAASLPDYGVTIERRLDFPRSAYPLWSAYGAPPDGAYTAQEVSIPSPKGHVLAGTLTLPRNGRPSAAVVLITGLSPSERNGGAPPWMPFRDLADALTRAGVAVLRVDDRGIAKSTGDHKPSTTFDEADDVRTEVAWLRARRDIDPARIALVGYSEGGLIAPMLAAADHRIAGVVTLAGPGVPGPELAREQITEQVMRDPYIAAADKEKEIARQLADPLSPREASFLGIDPLVYAAQVRCPALIVQGGSDITVPLRSAERLAQAMRAGGNRDVTVRLFPGVSHSLLPDPVGLPTGWAYLPGFITAPAVLDELAAWTRAHLVAAPARGRAVAKG